ncbi:9551_t:CDS:2, partial [Gigaspora margarita]
GIIFATKKNILFKIVKGSQPDHKIKHKNKEKKRRSILYTSTIQISKLHRKLTKMYKTSEFIDSRTLLESNQIILEVNTKLDTQIQALSNTINKEWLDDLKGWWRVLFRRWENVNGQAVLISDPTEVKRRMQQYFQTQYQNRNTTNEKYKTLLTAITIDEWSSMLSNLKNKTAPGISGIGYLLIKNVNKKMQEWFISFA